jgi:glucose-6-phosphate isomerase
MATKIWTTPEWAALRAHAEALAGTHLRTLLADAPRCASMVVEAEGVTADFSRQRATPETLKLLLALADAADLRGKVAGMFAGKHLNITEDRSVLHPALRAPRGGPALSVDGQDVSGDVHAVLDKIRAFSDKVRSGQHRGATGKPLTDIVSIGIGGSYLGVEFVYESLRCESVASAAAAGRRLRFLANVDPTDVARALEGLDPETTLVLVISKTFTTAETMLNARTVRDWLVRGVAGKTAEATEAAVVACHMAAVSTAVPLVTKFGISPENIFGFWDWVGGRYSVASAVGMTPLSLHFGFPVMQRFLDGAHSIDAHFAAAPTHANLPVLMGLFGVWNATFLGFGSRALLPYAQALLRFPAHIQQVSMESNGKRVTAEGEVVPFETGVAEFGEPGTNGQHSFYQLLHQGRTVPADFIGFCESQTPKSLAGEPVSNHDELMSNFFAQPDALALGKTAEEVAAEGVPAALVPHKVFAGNRPSVSLLLPKLDAYTAGQLLALYEHRTAVEGFVWGIASFDQWGVELGKVLAKGVRSQLVAGRADAAAATAEAAAAKGFNPATAALLAKYLAHK